MKLSKTQQHVVDMMRAGWELGVSVTMDGRCWLQQGGIGHGGQTELVRHDTLHALRQRGVIKQVSRVFPLEKYALVEKGNSHGPSSGSRDNSSDKIV